MKILLTLLVLSAPGLAHAQGAAEASLPLDPDTHRITYSEVVQVPGVSQAELYTRAKLWFADTFKSAKDVVQADEKDAGIVQGEGWSPMQAHFLGPNLPVSELRLWYKVKLACKDGRYRYEVSDFRTNMAPTANYPNALPATPVEALIATWQNPPAKKPAKAAQYAAVYNELTTGTAGNANALTASIRAGMIQKPGGTAGGKDW